MNKTVRSFIIGTVLGDGSLCGKVNKHLYVGHSEKQKDYLIWKKDFIDKNMPVGTVLKEAKSMTSPNKNRLTFYKLWTNSHHKLTSIYKRIYIDGEKRITKWALDNLEPNGLAVLFMDDGCKETVVRKHGRVIRSFKISLGGFPKEDVELLSKWLLDKYNINSRVYLERRKYPCLKITIKEDKEKFIKLIEEHLHPSMLYKIQV